MRINGAAFFKQSFELKIKGDLIPEAAAEEIIGELQSLFARHRINFEWGMLNSFSFQLSSFRFFFRGAGRGAREDEAREGRDGGGVSRVRNGLSDRTLPDAVRAKRLPVLEKECLALGAGVES